MDAKDKIVSSINTGDKTTKDEPWLQIHIVGSVKGGCGKTAFSLFKALEIAREEREQIIQKGSARYAERKDRKAPVLWLDADFKGTGSKALLYGKDEQTFEYMNRGCTLKDLEGEYSEIIYDGNPSREKNWLRFDSGYVAYTINDYLRGDIKEPEKMIVRGHAYKDELQKGINEDDRDEDEVDHGVGVGRIVMDINGFLDFIFSSPDSQDKKIFQYGGNLPTVEIGRFTYYMQKILTEIYEMGRMDTNAAKKTKASVRWDLGYRHIVLDMPPGDDAYSEALVDMIYKWAGKQKKGGIQIHHYLMTTSDRGHVEAMLSELKDITQRLKKYPAGEGVELAVVLSEVSKEEFKHGKVLDSIKKSLENFDGIKIVKSCYQEEYYLFCRGDLAADDPKEKWFAYNIEEV